MPLFLLSALLAFGADQLSKIWIRNALGLGQQSDFVPGWIHFEHVHNYGAAWGAFAGQKWLLIVFTAVVVVGMLVFAREVVKRGRITALGFGLILGGALGNLLDRIWQGYVTDFLDLDTPIGILQTFPVFNVADSCLTVGVILLIGASLFAPKVATEPSVQGTL